MISAAVIDALRARGLITAAAPPPPEPADRPWFVSVLLGIAGWIAGLFVIVFLAILLDVKSAQPVALIGLVLLAMAIALYYANRDFVFLDQLALAFSIAGQLAIAAYFAEHLNNYRLFTAEILGMQLVIYVVMPDRTAKTLAMFFASLTWVFLVRFWMRPYESGGDFLDAQGNINAPLFGAWSLPIEWLITWLPLIAGLTWLRRIEPKWMVRFAEYARPALTGLLLGVALGGICAEPAILLVLGETSLGREFSAWSLFPLLSIGLALVAAFNAYAMRSAALTGVGIVAALAHLARFYYLYGTTLTMKAAIMLAAGLLMLGASGFVARAAQERS